MGAPRLASYTVLLSACPPHSQGQLAHSRLSPGTCRRPQTTRRALAQTLEGGRRRYRGLLPVPSD